MSVLIKENKQPKLSMPSFTIDTILDKILNQYDITSLMNKSNFTLFLGRAGSGKTSLMTSFLKTKDLFHKFYSQIFMPSTSRSSIKDGFVVACHLPLSVFKTIMIALSYWNENL
jgi:hypothetical protein